MVLMERIKFAGWIATILLLLARPAAAAPANAIAVADFETKTESIEARDWAYGLADWLAAELDQRGVTVFERAQIRLALGERLITASGLMGLQVSEPQEIPPLRYLVTGQVEQLGNATNRQFHLDVFLLDAKTGRIAAGFARGGAYPQALSTVLPALAGQITDRLRADNYISAAITPASNFGPQPEVQLLFYKGVDYCLSGQPEMAVSWFIDATHSAPDFLPARLWAMRAFEMTGVPELAKAAREEVIHAPNGRGVLNRLEQSPFLNQKLISVAVFADAHLDEPGLKLRGALQKALGRQSNFFVADPSNIRSLAAEMDLQVAEMGRRELESASLLWSTMDALVLVRSNAADTSKFSVDVCDTLSDGVIQHREISPDAVSLDNVARELANDIATRGKTISPAIANRHFWSKRATKPVQVSNTDRNEFAGLLKYLGENPSDRDAWMRLALFARWLDDRDQWAIADSVIAATDPDASDAASWTSTALWHRRYYERENPPLIETEFAPILQGYPTSPEAQYARSAWALEMVDQQKYAQAARLFLRLADELPHLGGAIKIGPDFWANFDFFAAASLHETGDNAGAERFLAQAAEILKNNSQVGLLPYSLGENWGNPFPQTHPLFGPGLDLRQAVAAWQARLHPVHFTSGGRMSLEDLDAMLTAVKQLSGTNAAAQQMEFIQRLIENKEANPALYAGRITDSDYKSTYRTVQVWGQGLTYGYFSLPGKLVNEATCFLGDLAPGPRAQSGQVRRLAAELAVGLDAPIAANCFEAAGDYKEALHKVELATVNPTPFPKLNFGMHPTREQTESANLRRQKIRLLQKMGRKQDAADYARVQARMQRGDADAQLAAVKDAADVVRKMHRRDEAGEILKSFVKEQERAGAMTSQSAAARLDWAEDELAGGDAFAASEILRDVVKQSEGRDWGVALQTGYTKTYDAAVAALARVRTQAQFPAASTEWSRPMRGQEARSPEDGPTTDLERDLAALLRGTSSGPGRTSYGGAPVNVFVHKYGAKAVPAVLRAADRGDFPAHLIAQLNILDQIATPANAAEVLEAFKKSPRLAKTAFRLDAASATVILKERFGVYAAGEEIPPELYDVVEKYRLKDQYPVLVANLSAKAMDGNTAREAAAVDRVLRHGAPGSVRRTFRAALASILKKEMLANYNYGLQTISETALKNGVTEGIEASLRSAGPAATNSLSVLRKYIDLPSDDANARTVVEAGLGRWRWNGKTHKFVLEEITATRND